MIPTDIQRDVAEALAFASAGYPRTADYFLDQVMNRASILADPDDNASATQLVVYARLQVSVILFDRAAARLEVSHG